MGRPLFLTQLMKILFTLGLILGFVTIISFFDMPGIKYGVNGHAVSHQFWLTHGVPVFILISFMLLVVGYVIKKEFVWGRKLALALLIANILFSILRLIKTVETYGINRINLVNLLSSFIAFGLGYWYFYIKSNVVKYYESLEK